MMTDQDIGDAVLVELLTNGDQKAFALIYNKYVPELFRFVNRTIGRQEDAEEILQDIFESLWKRREDLADISSLGAYLYSMAKYKTIRYFKHRSVVNRYIEHYRLFEAVYDSLSEEERNSETVHERSSKQCPGCQNAATRRYGYG